MKTIIGTTLDIPALQSALRAAMDQVDAVLKLIATDMGEGDWGPEHPLFLAHQRICRAGSTIRTAAAKLSG